MITHTPVITHAPPTWQVRRWRFRVQEVQVMLQAGIFHEDDRIELMEGELVAMSPIGSRHAACVSRLIRLTSSWLQDRAIVTAQNPIRLGEYSEPQPDITLLKPRADFYAAAHPTPADVLLVIEIAETTVDYDREVKAPLYAQHGVIEMWLVNLAKNEIEILREPSAAGYRLSRKVLPGETLGPLAFPEVTIDVKEILG